MLKEEEGFGRAWSKRQTSPATARPGVLGGKRLTGDLSRRNRAWSFQKKPEHFKTWGCRADGYFPKACSLQTSKCARRSSCALKNQQISQRHCSFPTAVTVVAVRKPQCTTSWYLHRCLFKLILLLLVCFSQTLCLQGSRGDNVSPFCPPARKSSVLKKKIISPLQNFHCFVSSISDVICPLSKCLLTGTAANQNFFLSSRGWARGSSKNFFLVLVF